MRHLIVFFILLMIPIFSFSQFDESDDDDILSYLKNNHPEPEKVMTDLLPLLLDNIYNFDFPTADSTYRANNNPTNLMDSLYYYSINEWDYLYKRGFVIHDSLISLSRETIDNLRNFVCFSYDSDKQLFEEFLNICDSTRTQSYDKAKVIDNKNYYDLKNFVAKYGRKVNNGVIIFTPIAFSKYNIGACFAITALWQDHDIKYLIIANKQLKKWRISEMREFEGY